MSIEKILEKLATLIINQIDALFNIKSIRCHGFQGFSPKIITFKGIHRICFINECYRINNIQEPIATRARKMPKTLFLHKSFRTVKFFVIAFIIIPPKSETVSSLNHILFKVFKIVSNKIHTFFTISRFMQLAMRSKGVQQLSELDHLVIRSNLKLIVGNFCNVASKKSELII